MSFKKWKSFKRAGTETRPYNPYESAIIGKYLQDLKGQLSVVAPTFAKKRIAVGAASPLIFGGRNSIIGTNLNKNPIKSV
jgi:hypothetical protein